MFGLERERQGGALANRLDQVVLHFEGRAGKPQHPWTVRHACQGTQVFGATGSGKTTGSGRHIALHMLQCGFGGLVLCAKDDELALWADPERGYGALTGRRDDIVIVGTNLELYRDWGYQVPDGGHRFNFLNYEYQHGKGARLTHNLVALFSTAMEAGQDRESTSDPYWEDALRQLLTNAIDLAAMATGTIRLPDLARIVRTAPQNRSEAQSKTWQEQSPCWSCLRQAQTRTKDDPERHKDLEETIDYWLLDFAGLSDRTRSVIVSSFTSKATPLLRSPLRGLFCNEAPDTITPDDSHRGKIIVLDLPVKEYGEAGRFAQIIFKTVWQRATERRDVGPDTPPVFLWADESQYFVTPHDMLFQQTARSKLAATVYLTQSVSNYYAVMARRGSTAATDSLLGNLQTKIFHANGDPATNEWAERLFARDIVAMKSRSRTTQGEFTRGRHESLQSIVPAKTFTVLREGGPANKGIVDAVIFQGGRRWGDDGEHYLEARFQQEGY